MKMYKILAIMVIAISVAAKANAGVTFITDLGKDESFNENFTNSFVCPNNYVKCQSPTIGKGNSCDGKYLKCICPAEYVECKLPKVGSGVGCEGKYKPTDCKCSSDYTTLCNGANNSTKPGAETCDGKYKKDDCLCPSTWYDAKNCESPKVLSGKTCDSAGLVYTKYEKCSCPSEYVICKNGGTGASCSDDEGTKYKTCRTSTPVEGINRDGYIDLRNTGSTAFDLYGHYATVDFSPSKTLDYLWIRFWGDVTVKGALTIDDGNGAGVLDLNNASYSTHPKDAHTVTFEDKVIVNGVLRGDPYGTFTFKKGISGEFTCEEYVCNSWKTQPSGALACNDENRRWIPVKCPTGNVWKPADRTKL